MKARGIRRARAAGASAPLGMAGGLLLALGCCDPGRAANLCINPGFETPEGTSIFGFPGVPAVFGDWGGDLSRIVTAERDINPWEGSQMLRFDATGNAADPGLVSAQVYQLVDVSSLAAWITAGSATASFSAWFNRVPGDSQTDTSLGIAVYALSGAPAGFQQHMINGTYLAVQSAGVLTDAATLTWEQASGNLTLPAATDYLAIQLTAYENIHNDGSAPEFDGHYADGVSLQIIPEPSSCGLLACAAALSVLRRRGN